MKHKLALVLLLFAGTLCKAQNLIPNGDMEQYITCPTNQGQSSNCVNYYAVNPSTAATDYLNACSTDPGSDVPVNNIGYQQAHSGNAYCGIFIMQNLGANTREYVEGGFTSTLTAGTCYHFEMYVNLGNTSKYTSNDISVYFADTLISGVPNFYPLPYIPQITNTNPTNADTLNWTLITGNYTATGTENYFIIGNFTSDAMLNTTTVNPNGSEHIYFYVDDVSLTICTGINEAINNASISIAPNPTQGTITITSPAIITNLTITNTLGQLIKQTQPHEKTTGVTINNRGIHFITITTNSDTITKKVVVE